MLDIPTPVIPAEAGIQSYLLDSLPSGRQAHHLPVLKYVQAGVRNDRKENKYQVF